MMMTPSKATAPELQTIVDAIRTRHRFAVSSHSRPDGDSIGSQLAMSYALRALGKDVRVVNSDAAAPPLMAFPGVPEIEIADRAEGDFDAAIIMECGELARTGVAGRAGPAKFVRGAVIPSFRVTVDAAASDDGRGACSNACGEACSNASCRRNDSLAVFSRMRRTRYAMPGINSPTGV